MNGGETWCGMRMFGWGSSSSYGERVTLPSQPCQRVSVSRSGRMAVSSALWGERESGGMGGCSGDKEQRPRPLSRSARGRAGCEA